MILTIIAFLLARVGITAVLNWMVANTVGLYAILAFLIFAGLAMTFIPGSKDKPSKAKKWGWICFIAAVLLYAAIGFLKPFVDVLAIVIAIMLAIVLVIAIKRPIWKWLKTATFANWLIWLLRLL